MKLNYFAYNNSNIFWGKKSSENENKLQKALDKTYGVGFRK